MTALSTDDLRTGFARLLTPDETGRMTVHEAQNWLMLTSREENIAGSIVAAATVMRQQMRPVIAPPNAIDVCGTGGDGQHTLNISTAVAIVTAACGVPVAKHGNRAASSQAGGADTLEALGLNLERASARASDTLADLGIAFLFAQRHHPALSWLAPLRKAVGVPTVLNYIGPLCNPATVYRQLIGVPNAHLFDVFKRLAWDDISGLERVMVVLGRTDDESVTIDEIATFGTTHITGRNLPLGLADHVSPKDAGLPTHPIEAIRGGDASHNAHELFKLLSGDPQQNNAYRDAVLINTAGALIVAGEVANWRNGVEEARETIDKGLALALLKCWIKACE